jgi:hypothetical protein
LQAVHGTGGLIRFSSLRANKGHITLHLRVYAHLVSVAEQAVVRSLEYLQFIAFDRAPVAVKRILRLRRNWKTNFFVTPLARLASAQGVSVEVLETARQLNHALLPEVLSDDAPVFHANGIRIQCRRLEGPVRIVRHLVALGNRDGYRPFDIHVIGLALDNGTRLHILNFLVDLAQVWARRVILDDTLARALFDAELHRAPEWPPFRAPKSKPNTFYHWTPPSFVKGLMDLWTFTKQKLAPSDSQPPFPRSRYGNEAHEPLQIDTFIHELL